MLDRQAARSKPLDAKDSIRKSKQAIQGLVREDDVCKNLKLPAPVASRSQHHAIIGRNVVVMTEYPENNAVIGKASLHVSLAALGLLAILAVAGWTVYANNFSSDGLACRDRGGRMTWSGCGGTPGRPSAGR
jgi:hypothetical protein